MAKADKLIQQIKDMDLRPRAYSGRGMYGAQCVGVSVDRMNEVAGLPGGWSHDQLGKGYIVYWPDVAWPEVP